MPAIDANASGFLATSDYPQDKVIYMASGSFSASAGSTTQNIAHGLPFKPLLDGTWSTDSTFALSYDMGSGPVSTVAGALFNIEADVSSDSTNAIITVGKATAGSTTIYYRIFGFEPSTDNLSADYTANSADSFILNLDYNYTKLYDANAVTTSTVVSHGLGYKPQVSMWEETSGTIRKKNENRNGTAANTYTTITTTAVTITFDGSAPAGTKAHYRIYLDT